MTSSRLTSVAADMRAKAKAASESPWNAWSGSPGGGEYVTSEPTGYTFGISPGISGDRGWDLANRDAAYIAAMHPAVALALADWLDSVASDTYLGSVVQGHALALCDAYEGSVDMRAKGES